MPLEQTLEKLKTKKEMMDMIEEIVKKEIERRILPILELIKGKDGESIKGDKGNSIKGDDGYTPIKGKDYFDGKKGDDGYTPIKNKDYFDGKDGSHDTPKQIAIKLNTLKGMILPSIIKDFDSYFEKVKIDTEQQKEGIIAHISGLIGTRRNVAKLVRNKPEVPRGIIDGVNKDFYLSRIPFAGFILLETNGAGQTKDTDFTLDGAKISYTTALPVGSNHQATFF